MTEQHGPDQQQATANQATDSSDQQVPIKTSDPDGKDELTNSIDILRTRWKRRGSFHIPHWVQFSIFVAAVVYGGLTYRLWDTTREGIYSGQRAYVVVTGVSLSSPLQPNQPVTIRVVITNTGMTPALNVRTRTTPGITGVRPEHTPDATAKPLIDVDLGAGQIVTTSTTMSVPLTQARFDALVAAQLRLFLVISITYEDVFPDSEPNMTETCVVYDIKTRDFESCGSTIC